MNEPYLLPGLKRSTRSVRRILALIPNASLDMRQEGRLTPREALAHLADLEPFYRARMESVHRDLLTGFRCAYDVWLQEDDQAKE